MSTAKENIEQEESFRDRIATVDKSGKRKWVFAQKPRGRFTNWRNYVSWLFFAVFLSIPFIQVNGRPLLLFNIPEAKFILFGKVFWPQDFFIFGLTMVSFVIFVVLFTAAFGRLFCGWICPQTIFMEMVFRKIEYLIEGDASEQRLLAKGPWNTDKILKKTSKHLIFYLMSFIIANFFLAYIIGVKDLWKIITEPVSEHFIGFLSLLLFSGIFYGVYAFFREQVCTVVCPYGRLQGVLLDRNSMIVAYDYKRGEPRGKLKDKEALSLGDCIDCLQCVKVCPTGIDIRNGTQLECVNCTACIDACDAIMDKVGRPRGLIRYASENGIASREPLRYTTRMKLYTALLLVLVVILSSLLITRKDVDATVMRTPGMLYQERGTDSISNLYNIKVANKTMQEIPLTVKLENKAGKVELIGGKPIIVKQEGQGSGSFFIVVPREAIQERKNILQLGLYHGTERIDLIKTTFLGPVKQ
ncbi:cytochrome c oxidase accessory protein CcoG [Flavihumibacter sp. CACIAM 22H1]|uniref:cytochrome c oxidase accessory protein CcoG n=1 Tax=Flavihumibacter sp. CACIAM 22H1 TaxID=1812911 RepID=UPI0007A8E960|nr:cytochrome c oxidase accessory protein CcoG [Flavihumibacter sp. CACIAM 22H1]KYP13209.1 MAG: cytochrome c oxidase accessory protein CcoG [Flavihumibacter sp. CACIAM 22H1]